MHGLQALWGRTSSYILLRQQRTLSRDRTRCNQAIFVHFLGCDKGIVVLFLLSFYLLETPTEHFSGDILLCLWFSLPEKWRRQMHTRVRASGDSGCREMETPGSRHSPLFLCTYWPVYFLLLPPFSMVWAWLCALGGEPLDRFLAGLSQWCLHSCSGVGENGEGSLHLVPPCLQMYIHFQGYHDKHGGP